MMEFTAPTPRTLKQEIGMVCSMIYNGTEMSVVTVRCIGEAVKEYKQADYSTYKEMAKAILNDYVGCEYETAKIVNFEATVILKRNNNMNGDVNMTKNELREELAKRGVTLSNTEFKATKHQELVDRLEAEYILENARQNSNSLMVQEVAIPEEVQAPQFDIKSLAAMMVGSVTNGVKLAVEESVIPAVTNVVEDGNAKILAELKSQLDKMNSTIAGLVNTQHHPITPVQTRQAIAKCEDCDAPIYNSNVVKYSMANCSGHTYCYKHQELHKTVRTNPVGSFGKPQQQPTTVIYKQCMCCGTKTKYADENQLNQSVAKAQALGLKPIICKKCADKTLAERTQQAGSTELSAIEAEHQQSVTNFYNTQQPIAPQMPVGNIVQPMNPNNQGF